MGRAFTISTLRGLKKHCRGAIISESELANFIMWCKSDGPFLHSAHHRQFVPEHLTLSDSDLAALAANGVGRFKPAAQKVANRCRRGVGRNWGWRSLRGDQPRIIRR